MPNWKCAAKSLNWRSNSVRPGRSSTFSRLDGWPATSTMPCGVQMAVEGLGFGMFQASGTFQRAIFGAGVLFGLHAAADFLSGDGRRDGRHTSVPASLAGSQTLVPALRIEFVRSCCGRTLDFIGGFFTNWGQVLHNDHNAAEFRFGRALAECSEYGAP